MAARMIAIYVGAPENDKRISVSTDKTVSKVLEENNVNVSGMVQHGQKTLRPADYAKTLEQLNFIDNDTLHVVRKLDGARG